MKRFLKDEKRNHANSTGGNNSYTFDISRGEYKFYLR